MMRTHSMTDISDRIAILKKEFHSPDTTDEKKTQIIEYFKEYNEIFYGDIDIDSFFRQLMDLTRKWDNDE